MASGKEPIAILRHPADDIHEVLLWHPCFVMFAKTRQYVPSSLRAAANALGEEATAW